MGSKIQKIDKRYSPSPDAYNINQFSVGKHSFKWGFGTQQRGKMKNGGQSPGPGTYEQKSKAFQYKQPRFYMGTKLSPLKGLDKPGAGTYNPSTSQTKFQQPSFSVGAKLQSSLKGYSLSPGPGNYKVTMIDKKQAPQFGFGTSTRETGKGRRLDVPGPGTYKLNNTVADLPSYAIQNRSDMSKYV